MKNELISIIVPIFNEESYLEKCLNSIINQTYENLEIICVDDRSTDNSLEIIKKYEEKDARIKLIRQHENRGLSDARNLGIINASGKYVLFVDADDWISNETVESLYANAKSNNSDVVLFNSVENYPNKIRERIYTIPTENKDLNNYVFDFHEYPHLILRTFHVCWSKFYKKSFIDKHELRFKYKLFEDVTFHVNVMLCANRISYLPKILYHYRKDNRFSLQNTKAKTKESFIIFNIIDDIEEIFNERDLNEKYSFSLFAVSELKNRFDCINVEYKKELYYLIQKRFKKMKVNLEDLGRLYPHLKAFYLSVYYNDFENHIYNEYLFQNLKDINQNYRILSEKINELNKRVNDINNTLDKLHEKTDKI